MKRLEDWENSPNFEEELVQSNLAVWEAELRRVKHLLEIKDKVLQQRPELAPVLAWAERNGAQFEDLEHQVDECDIMHVALIIAIAYDQAMAELDASGFFAPAAESPIKYAWVHN